MTRIYTRTNWRNPWHMAMVLSPRLDTDALAKELRASGLQVFVFREPSRLVRPPKI